MYIIDLELAKFAFDRCITFSEDLPDDDRAFKIHLTYEFIDDVYNDWPCDVAFKTPSDEKVEGNLFNRKRKTVQEFFEQKESHPFSQMVS